MSSAPASAIWLTKRDGSNAWVVTGYEENPGDEKAGRAAHSPTHAAASLTRDDMGAGSSSVAQSPTDDNPSFSRKAGDAQQQFKDTERAYGGRAAYEQAKAAGKTKLTYGQWVQVRTPSFKQWFGDWEVVKAKDALQEMQPVIITADEVLQNGTIAEVRQRAKQVYDSAAKLGPVHMQDGRTVQLTGVGFRETKSHSADRKVLELMASIREVLEKATALASKPHKLANSTDSIRAWHYYGAKVNLRGKEFLAKLVVRESVNGQIYYDNDLSSMEEIGGRAVGATPANPEAAAGSADGLNLAQWWNSVNPAEVSKVIDPQTGEPMVQYHGTHLDFSASACDAKPSTGRHSTLRSLLGRYAKGQLTFALGSNANRAGRGQWHVPRQRTGRLSPDRLG